MTRKGALHFPLSHFGLFSLPALNVSRNLRIDPPGLRLPRVSPEHHHDNQLRTRQPRDGQGGLPYVRETANCRALPPGENIKIFSACKVPALVGESEPEMGFTEEQCEEAASDVRDTHQGSTAGDVLLVPSSLQLKAGVK